MTKGLLAWHQLDESLPAKGSEAANLLVRHRAGGGPDVAMIAIGEGVFSVEFEVVDLPFGQFLHQREQRLHRWHFVAADVEHDPARREIWMVLDLAGGQGASALALNLPQRHRTIKRSRRIRRRDGNALFRDAQPITRAEYRCLT